MKVLIQYKSSSKIRDLANYDQLLEIIETTFEIKREFFMLQNYDEEFDEYVDFEDFSTLKEKSKIKVVDLSCKALVENKISDNSTVLNNDFSIENDLTDSSTLIDPPMQIALNLKPQWPACINLPINNFSKPLLDTLEREQELSWSQSSELVSHLAIYAYNFKKYPNKAERIQICETLVQKFPYLKNDVGQSTGAWEVKLHNKLKKIRQNDTSLEINLNKIKRKSISSKTPKKIKLNPEKGEVNWAPDHLDGEDENTLMIHKQIMNEESKKSHSFQDKNKIRALMNITYSFRRNAINNKISVKELKNEYPIFFQIEEQFEEFERLTSINIKETFFKEISLNGTKLLNLFLGKQTNSLNKIKADVESTLQFVEDGNNLEVKTILGLYVLPCLLKEPLESFIKIISDVELELQSVTPKIFALDSITSTNFYIVVENEIICESQDFITAIALLLSFMYTMNLGYPKDIKDTLKFIQKYFLKINSGTFPNKIHNLYHKMLLN